MRDEQKQLKELYPAWMLARQYNCSVRCLSSISIGGLLQNTSSLSCRLMHQRFLAGEDDGVDYRAVDSDAKLDDDWAAERQQDAEDAYFDSME